MHLKTNYIQLETIYYRLYMYRNINYGPFIIMTKYTKIFQIFQYNSTCFSTYVFL